MENEFSYALLEDIIDNELHNGIEARYVIEGVNGIKNALKCVRDESINIGWFGYEGGYEKAIDMYSGYIAQFIDDMRDACENLSMSVNQIAQDVERELEAMFGNDVYDYVDYYEIRRRVFVAIANENDVWL